jgi:hypothetical protein
MTRCPRIGSSAFTLLTSPAEIETLAPRSRASAFCDGVSRIDRRSRRQELGCPSRPDPRHTGGAEVCGSRAAGRRVPNHGATRGFNATPHHPPSLDQIDDQQHQSAHGCRDKEALRLAVSPGRVGRILQCFTESAVRTANGERPRPLWSGPADATYGESRRGAPGTAFLFRPTRVSHRSGIWKQAPNICSGGVAATMTRAAGS